MYHSEPNHSPKEPTTDLASEDITQAALKVILENPNYKILKRVPEIVERRESGSSLSNSAVIIDLETLGLNPKTDAIIEIGLLKFSFDGNGLINVLDTYNELNDPKMPIPDDIIDVTGITSADVAGKEIDWEKVESLIKDCDFIICHNCKFDRNFLELQTPEPIQALFKSKPFACTMQDINWSTRKYGSRALEYLNMKLGYFYDAHRALTDCWATLNLLVQDSNAFNELQINMNKSETLICAVNTLFSKKDLLDGRKYRWSNGSGNLPKCWWKMIPNDTLTEEIFYLESVIYCKPGACLDIPITRITAQIRYSFRAQIRNLVVPYPLTMPAPTLILSTPAANPVKEEETTAECTISGTLKQNP